MKHIYNILSIFCALCFFACTAENETLNDGGVGYLRLTVGGSNETTTKAATLPDDYTGLQIAVEIVDAEGETIEKTDDWEEWKGESIALKAGKYTIKAHSYGFDGKQSAMAAPYYYGSKEITIENGKELNETVTCKLANVKMSVKVSDDIKANFKSFSVSVDPKTAGACDPLSFNIDLTKSAISDTAYFPVTDLIVNYSAINKSDKKNMATKELTGVKGNDHYILNFTLAGSVGVDDPVSVVVDPTMQTYTYTFYVSTTPTNNATVSANAWAKIAYLTATDVTVTSGTDISSLKFQYRKQSTQDWIDAAATLASETYSGKTGVLDASTTYECRMVNADESFATSPIIFTTEAQTLLPNSSFDLWSNATIKTMLGTTKNDVPYLLDPDESIIYGTSGDKSPISFWDSGNAGGASMGKYPTKKFEDNGKIGAVLSSQYIGLGSLGKFAAGNIYTGHYYFTNMSPMGAQIFFGQPFTSRPIQLKGRFKYTRGETVDQGDDPYKSELTNSGGDQCGLYIALTDNEGLECDGNKYAFEIDNLLSADEPGNFKYKNSIDFTENNPNIVAYGTISEEEAKGTGEWQEFTIDLKYRDLTRQPKYIIVVASASKYGDYFTGSTSSVMYVDDFELIYDGEPVLWNEAQK